MGDGFQFIDIILFAMIAAFLVLRLRSVLGRHKDSGDAEKPNQQEPFSVKSSKGVAQNIVSLPERKTENNDGEKISSPETPLESGIHQIRKAAPDFDRLEFLVGARTAFEMIVQAFAEGDTDLLETLLNDDVYNNFLQAIRSREAENQTLENTLVRIVEGEMIEAYMEDTIANVTIKIVSEQVNLTRSADGEVVDGDDEHISQVTDIWTFARDTAFDDPNWQLVATRSLD